MLMINDHFQNKKQYNIPPAQLVIADIPYNVGKNAYGSNPKWYVDGDNKNGESELAGKQFFDTDKDFRIPEFFAFCGRFLKPEPKESGKAPCLIVFCAYEQQADLITEAAKHGFKNYIPLQFYKNYSPQVLKANMRIVGNTEFAKMVKENIDKKIKDEVNEYVSDFDINKAFSSVLYTKLSNIIDEIKKTQDTLDICF